MELDAGGRAGVHGLGGVVEIFPGGDGFAEVVESEEAGLLGIVEVGGGVSDFVREVYQLGLDGRAEIGEVLVQIRILAGNEVAGVLDDAFAKFESEVQAGEPGLKMDRIFALSIPPLWIEIQARLMLKKEVVL